MVDQPGDLAYVWNRVIADLSGTSPGSGVSALSAQQRAFLPLTRPLGLIDHPLQPWQNRPTQQQVVEVTSHR